MGNTTYPGPLLSAHGVALHLKGDAFLAPDYGAAARIALAVNIAWADAWEAERRRLLPEQPVVSVGIGSADKPKHARRRGDKPTTLGDLLQRDDGEVARTAEHIGKLLKLPRLAGLGDYAGADRSEWFDGTQAPWEPGVYEVEWSDWEGWGWQFAEFVGVSDACPYGWRASLDACGHGLTPDGALQATQADYRPERWRGVSGIQRNHWRALKMIADHFPFPPPPVADKPRGVRAGAIGRTSGAT